MGRVRAKLRAPIVLSLFLAAELTRGVGAEVRVLRADLSFHFVCHENERATLENILESFLRKQGFRALNKGRHQREHGLFLSDLEIVGLDNRQRLISIRDIPPVRGRYAVVLNTPPPTKRSARLEEALLEFVSKRLRCDVRQVIRGRNAGEAAGLHNEMIRRIEDLFRQTDELQGKWKL